MATVTVTLVATVLNEYGGLPAWCKALEKQSRQPDEIIIVDGGSRDGTWEFLKGRSWGIPVRLIQMPDSSISQGRNRAIDEATSDVIAVTDAGTIASHEWLARLIDPFERAEVDVVAGFFRPSSRSIWSRSLGATTLPAATEVERSTFQPSSRSVAFRRRWFDIGFAYPEWLDYCEDLILDFSLRRAGATFELASGAMVTFEPRPNWQSFFVQYFRYARGDGKAGFFALRHVIRYATYALLSIVAIRRQRHELIVTGMLGLLYVRRPVLRLWSIDRAIFAPVSSTSIGLMLIPMHRFVGDLAKMAGYPVGLSWRFRTYGFRMLRINWKRLPPR